MSQIAPELVDQLVDPDDARLSSGSNVVVSWRCSQDPRHVWSASPNTRRRSGCPVCTNKLVIAGVNDLATTDPELAAQLCDTAESRAVHRGSHTKLWWSCTVSSTHRWHAAVASRVRAGAGCPYCSGRLRDPGANDLATTHPELVIQLVDPAQAQTVSAGSAKKLEWRCLVDADHTWSAAVRNRIGFGRTKPTGCPQCLGRTGRAYQTAANPRGARLAVARRGCRA